MLGEKLPVELLLSIESKGEFSHYLMARMQVDLLEVVRSCYHNTVQAMSAFP
jgi:hypothetical protein